MLKAGAAQVDISPKDSQFLFGYPHVKGTAPEFTTNYGVQHYIFTMEN